MAIRLPILALLCAAYGALHSRFASLAVKRWALARWPRLGPGYRLLYNGVAVLLLLPPLWLTLAWRGPLLWEWRGVWAWLADLLAVAAGMGFFWTLRYYDAQTFLGLRQWQRGGDLPSEREPFQLSPAHRYVRHPWYFFSLVIIWTRNMDPAFLVSSSMITLYFWLGSQLEENKLLACHGAVYARYRERVPALFPLPWRYLSRVEAETLLSTRQSSAGD